MATKRLSQVIPAAYIIRTITIAASGSWTPPAWAVGCFATVRTVGPGGSGGLIANSASGRVTGGGAGGHAIKRALLTNIAHTAVVGAGGAALSSSGTVAGNAGGSATTFVGGAFNLSGGAGGGGGAATTGTVAGGTGGTASGGDVNYTGGRGGNAGNIGAVATGGGAVGWWQNGFNGGDPAVTTGHFSSGAGLGSDGFPYTTNVGNGQAMQGGNSISEYTVGRDFGRGGAGCRNATTTVVDEVTKAKDFGVGGGGSTGSSSSGHNSGSAGIGGGSGGNTTNAAIILMVPAGGNGVIYIEVEVPV